MNYIEKLKLVDVTKLSVKIKHIVQRSIEHFNYGIATEEGINSLKLLYEIICDKFPQAIENKEPKATVEQKEKRKYTKKEKTTSDKASTNVVKTGKKRGRPKKEQKNIDANLQQELAKVDTHSQPELTHEN